MLLCIIVIFYLSFIQKIRLIKITLVPSRLIMIKLYLDFEERKMDFAEQLFIQL